MDRQVYPSILRFFEYRQIEKNLSDFNLIVWFRWEGIYFSVCPDVGSKGARSWPAWTIRLRLG
jgi:hypothetical protein